MGMVTALCGIAHAEETGMSFNSEISIVPAPGPVTIDGDSKDWDMSAGVWSYNTPTITDSFSVWTHLMWDDRGVYFLARFADKTHCSMPPWARIFPTVGSLTATRRG